MRRTMLALLALALLALAGFVAPACADGDSGDQSLVVFAAASLTDAFEELATAFEGTNPGVVVELSFAGSSALREQILDGAPADVFASANSTNVQAVVDAGDAGEPADVARNELQIVVPAGNEAGVAGLADLGREELLVGLCALEVPCGELGRQVLADVGVTPAPDTEEPDVRALLAKVAAGELDVGLVYRTDVLAAGDAVEGIEIPDADAVVATYAIVVLTGSDVPDLAEAFVAFVLSADGQAVLTSYGFDGP